MEPIKLDEIDMVIVRGVAASERDVSAAVARHRKDAETAFAYIAERHKIDPSRVGVDFGFDMEKGLIVEIKQPDAPPGVEAKGIDPRS